MALSDMAARNAKAAEKAYKLYDEGGLYLFVTPSGGRLWRMKYRWAGAESVLSIGAYPEIGLKQARQQRDDAKVLLANDVNPFEERKRIDAAKRLEKSGTFRIVALELIEKRVKDGYSAKTLYKMRWFLSLIDKDLGDRPMVEMEPFEVLQSIKKVEARGHYETANRVKAFVAKVFRYAIITGRAKTNPAADLGEALIKPKVKHHAALLDPHDVGQLLRDIDMYHGYISTKLALQLLPHVFVRPGELRFAEWTEFPAGADTWKLPEEKMKMGEAHEVPLSRQALAILSYARGHFGNYRLVFPAQRDWNKPMSDNTLNSALRKMGYKHDDIVAHGFRSTASTLLNESRLWSPDAIELALSHVDDSVRGIYQRSQYWEERVEMAQWWSDYLDHLKAGVDILSPKKFAEARRNVAPTPPSPVPAAGFFPTVTMTFQSPIIRLR